MRPRCRVVCLRYVLYIFPSTTALSRWHAQEFRRRSVGQGKKKGKVGWGVCLQELDKSDPKAEVDRYSNMACLHGDRRGGSPISRTAPGDADVHIRCTSSMQASRWGRNVSIPAALVLDMRTLGPGGLVRWCGRTDGDPWASLNS